MELDENGLDEHGMTQIERERQLFEEADRVENLVQHIARMEDEGGINFDERHPMGGEQEQFESAWMVIDPVADLAF
jgi:hypothetical protein